MSRQVEPIVKSGKKRKPKTPMKACDELAGKIVRARGVCEECGKTSDLQWAHGFSRRYRAIRWDMRNGFALCRGDHLKYTMRPLEWDEWLHAKWGDELYDEMRDLALHGRNPDLKDTLAALRLLAAAKGIS